MCSGCHYKRLYNPASSPSPVIRMAGLTQVVLGLFLQFTQPAEARTTAVKEVGVQEMAAAQAPPYPGSIHFSVVTIKKEKVDGKEYTLLEVGPSPRLMDDFLLRRQQEVDELNGVFDHANIRLRTESINNKDVYLRATLEGVIVTYFQCAPDGIRTTRVSCGKYRADDCGERTTCVKQETVQALIGYDDISGAQKGYNRGDLEVMTNLGIYRFEFRYGEGNTVPDVRKIGEAIRMIHQINDEEETARAAIESRANDPLVQYAERLREAYSTAKRRQAEVERAETHAQRRKTVTAQRCENQLEQLKEECQSQVRQDPGIAGDILECRDPPEYICQ